MPTHHTEEEKEIMGAGTKHYLKNGKEYKGAHHKMPNGQIHTGKKHTKNSKRLYKTKRR